MVMIDLSGLVNYIFAVFTSFSQKNHENKTDFHPEQLLKYFYYWNDFFKWILQFICLVSSKTWITEFEQSVAVSIFAQQAITYNIGIFRMLLLGDLIF